MSGMTLPRVGGTLNSLFLRIGTCALQPSNRWRGEHPSPLSQPALHGLAWLIAVALHGGVVLLLWERPAPPALSIQPVAIRMIERPTPPPAPPVAPSPPSAAMPEPTPAPAKIASTKPPRPDRKPRELAPVALRDEPAPAPVTPVAEPAVAAVDPAPPSVATPPPAAAPLSADAEPPELSVHCPRRPPPQYPMAARRLGEEGVVELLVALSADGSVRQVSVSRPSGFGRLDQAAVAAVRLWQCDPIRVAGVPAAATARQRIHFSLR